VLFRVLPQNISRDSDINVWHMYDIMYYIWHTRHSLPAVKPNTWQKPTVCQQYGVARTHQLQVHVALHSVAGPQAGVRRYRPAAGHWSRQGTSQTRTITLEVTVSDRERPGPHAVTPHSLG
jgi:hypothetical protein